MERVKQFAAQLGVGSGVTALERKSADDVCITMAIRSPLCKARKGGFKDARYVPGIMIRIPCADRATGQTNLCLRSSRCAGPFPRRGLHSLYSPKASIAQSGIDPALIGDISVGTVLTQDALYQARSAALAAGIPNTVPISHVNRFCSSGLMSVTAIANQIRAGQIDIGLAIGVESMTDNPDKGGPPQSELISQNSEAADCPKPMGWTSENVAAEFNITRDEQDEFAALSFQRAEHAQKAGYFAKEIVPFTVFSKDSATGARVQKVVSQDDGIRYGTTKENLAKIWRECEELK